MALRYLPLLINATVGSKNWQVGKRFFCGSPFSDYLLGRIFPVLFLMSFFFLASTVKLLVNVERFHVSELVQRFDIQCAQWRGS
jgi:hypothetical protein